MATTLGLRTNPAEAAAGDATAQGLIVELGADVGGVAVLSSSTSAGSAVAPPGGEERLVGVDASGTGVSGGAAAVEVRAASSAIGSSARSIVSGVDLRLLGRPGVTAEVLEATAACPTFGSGDGETTIAASGLAVLGQAVSLEAGTPRTVSSAVDLGIDPGLGIGGGLGGLGSLAGVTAATLEATVSRIEVDEPTAARATAVEVAFALTVAGPAGTQTVDVGAVTLARAACERPPLPPLTVTSLSPPSGPMAGGTPVTITGTGFFPGATTVSFGGLGPVAANVNDDGTTLVVATPPSPAPGPVDVTVTTPAETVTLPGAYTYLPLDAGGAAGGSTGGAAVSGLQPGGGPTSGGTTLTISGSGLAGTSGVTVDGVPATGVVASPDGTTVSAVTPPRESAGPVAVALDGANGAEPAAAGTFTYAGPTITAVDPDRGPLAGGTRVTVRGTGLAGAGAVTFGDRMGSDLVVEPDGTRLAVTTPAGVRPGPTALVVQLAGQDASAPDGYTYLNDGTRPAVDGLQPDRGPAAGGTVVTITGSGLAGASGVSFGGVPGRDLLVSADGTRLTVTTPAGSAGSVPVVVRMPRGTEVLSVLAFTYEGGTAAAAAPAPPRRSGLGVLAQTGLSMLGVALVGVALASAGHLIRSRR